jgi:hypothetical protein
MLHVACCVVGVVFLARWREGRGERGGGGGWCIVDHQDGWVVSLVGKGFVINMREVYDIKDLSLLVYC